MSSQLLLKEILRLMQAGGTKAPQRGLSRMLASTAREEDFMAQLVRELVEEASGSRGKRARKREIFDVFMAPVSRGQEAVDALKGSTRAVGRTRTTMEPSIFRRKTREGELERFTETGAGVRTGDQAVLREAARSVGLERTIKLQQLKRLRRMAKEQGILPLLMAMGGGGGVLGAAE